MACRDRHTDGWDVRDGLCRDFRVVRQGVRVWPVFRRDRRNGQLAARTHPGHRDAMAVRHDHQVVSPVGSRVVHCCCGLLGAKVFRIVRRGRQAVTRVVHFRRGLLGGTVFRTVRHGHQAVNQVVHWHCGHPGAKGARNDRRDHRTPGNGPLWAGAYQREQNCADALRPPPRQGVRMTAGLRHGCLAVRYRAPRVGRCRWLCCRRGDWDGHRGHEVL